MASDARGGAPAPSSDRVEARRRHLVEVAQALIRERGDAGFSMALLAERAGISAATPYNLLGSKSGLLQLVVREDIARFVRQLAARAGATPLATLLNAADLLVDHYEADHQFHVGLFHAAFSTDASEVRGVLSTESWAWWNTLVDAAIASGEIAGFVHAGQLTDALLRMMGGVVQTWLAEGWAPRRFAMEMSVSVRLVLASVSVPSLGQRMVAEVATLQAAIAATLCGDPPVAAVPAPAGPDPATDRRAILASRVVIVAFRLFEQVARGAALTIPQYRFLLMLKRGPRRASDLAAFSGIGRPTASALIAHMERAGLIVRRRDDGDGRAADLRVTDEGLRRYAAFEETLAAAFETLLDETDRDAVLDMMTRFSEGIDRRSRAGTAIDQVRDTNYPVAAGER